MKRMLITGGSGLLGGHLATQASAGFQVFTTYFKHEYYDNNINWKFLDLSKTHTIKLLIENIRPQIIIHTAAISSVDECESQTDLAFLINVKATEELAVICRENNIRLIFVSSDMVYDGAKGNYNEEDEVNPINYYGRTKVLAETKIQSHCSNYVIVRTALIYGTSRTHSKSFSEEILQRILNKQVVNLFYDQFRTPILVDNLAESLLALSENNFRGILNLGGIQRISRYNFGLEMASVFNFSAQWLNRCSMNDFITNAKRPPDVSLKISKAQAMLPFKFLDVKAGLTVSSAKNCNSLTKK